MAKVIFLNRFFHPDHSATSQLLSDLAFALAGRGFEVHVITSRQRYDVPSARLPAEETIQGVGVHRVWTSCFGRGFLPGRALDYATFYASAAWKLQGMVRRGDVVVAKTDPPLLSVMAAPVVGARKGMLVNWLQDVFPEVAAALGVKGMNGTLGRWLARLRDASLRHAVNVTIGGEMARRLQDLGVPEERIRVIHNWADGERVRPVAAEENLLRKAWGLDGKFVVGYSGNLGRAHEFGTVLDAAERLKEREEVRFLFIGGGVQRQRVEEEAARRGLAHVLFKPYQPRERLAETLSAADIHLISLLPRLEGFIVPSKLYGILAAGRPALFVGDRAGEVGRVLEEEQVGWTVEPGDGEGLAELIGALAEDAGRCREAGRRARRVFEARFDTGHAVEGWRKLLQEMMP